MGSGSRVAVIQRIAPADWTLPGGTPSPGSPWRRRPDVRCGRRRATPRRARVSPGPLPTPTMGAPRVPPSSSFSETLSPQTTRTLTGWHASTGSLSTRRRPGWTYPELSDLLARASELPGAVPEGPAARGESRREVATGRLSTRQDRLGVAIETYSREADRLEEPASTAKPPARVDLVAPRCGRAARPRTDAQAMLVHRFGVGCPELVEAALPARDEPGRARKPRRDVESGSRHQTPRVAQGSGLRGPGSCRPDFERAGRVRCSPSRCWTRKTPTSTSN